MAGDGSAAASASDLARPSTWMPWADDGFRLAPIGMGADGGFADVFGTIGARIEGDTVRCRVATGPGQANMDGAVHGGFIMALVDQAMFCAVSMTGRLPGSAVTMQAGVSFIGPARTGRPIDVVVEVVGETGRMLFLRGLIEQDGQVTGSFDGSLRKIRAAA